MRSFSLVSENQHNKETKMACWHFCARSRARREARRFKNSHQGALRGTGLDFPVKNESTLFSRGFPPRHSNTVVFVQGR